MKHLEKKLRENKEALENLVKALEQGKSIDIIVSQIEKRQEKKIALEVEISREKIQSSKLPQESIMFFFEQFKNRNKRDSTFCSSLIDLFVEQILLFEDKKGDYLEIACRASEKSNKIPLDEPKGSSKGDVCRSATKDVIAKTVNTTQHSAKRHSAIICFLLYQMAKGLSRNWDRFFSD